MFRLMPPLILLVAITGCSQTSAPSAKMPTSPFDGWSTPDALRAKLAGKAELSQINSDGGAGPPPSPWTQTTELTARMVTSKDLLSALREAVLARVEKSTWKAGETKDGADSFELHYSAGEHRGQITVRVTAKGEDRFVIVVGGDEK